MTDGNRRAILAALLANLGIAAAKFAAWIATASASMLAEAVHSVADTSNQALLLLGGSRARRDPTPEHSFGYGRERYFWAFVVSVVLFLLGGLFGIAEGLGKLREPHEVGSPGWAVGVLVTGIVLESFSFRTAIVESNRVRGGASWWSFIRHTKNPELPVVLLEDTGALLGLVLALVAVALSGITGDPAWDALGSVVIGTLLTLIALVLASEMKSLLIGESATPADRREIHTALRASPGVRELHRVRTVHLAPDELLVAARLELDAHLDTAGVARALDRAEAAVRQRVPAATLVYLEPDLGRPHAGADHANGADA